MAFPSTLTRTKNWGTEVLFDNELEGVFDSIINYIIAALHGTTGHAHTGASNQGPKISLTAGVSGVLPIANGGTGAATFLQAVYPVGCIYTTIDPTNPNTVFGFGTWVAFGSGRVLVGVDDGQAEFNGIEETGGAKTHTLVTGEMPAHAHETPIHSTNIGDVGSSSFIGSSIVDGNLSTSSVGGGGAHNNLQPYITAYFWKRTV